VRLIEVEPIQGTLTEAVDEHIRATAIADERVQSLLGPRFDHINTDMLDFGKDRRPNPAQPIATRVLFFSHTNNVAVEVEMVGFGVRRVRTRPGYQPAEGDGEIARAVALARADDRLASAVAGLAANAILAPRAAEDIGHGERILWVVFTDAADSTAEKPALFTAAVDLTGERVVMAGPAAPARPASETGGRDAE
jgi:hypothetical protein